MRWVGRSSTELEVEVEELEYASSSSLVSDALSVSGSVSSWTLGEVMLSDLRFCLEFEVSFSSRRSRSIDATDARDRVALVGRLRCDEVDLAFLLLVDVTWRGFCTRGVALRRTLVGGMMRCTEAIFWYLLS